MIKDVLIGFVIASLVLTAIDLVKLHKWHQCIGGHKEQCETN
jgi:hypothetical protein